jgi:hypothetical protein
LSTACAIDPDKTSKMFKSILISTILLLVSWTRPAVAEEAAVETLLSGLNLPTSVAIRPGGTAERYEVFVAESGARRVIKMESDRRNEHTDVVTQFSEFADSRKFGHRGNPLSLLFLDREHLVAGLGGTPPDVRLYTLADDRPTSAEQAEQRLSPEPGDTTDEIRYGACVALARTRANDVVGDMLLVSTIGDTFSFNMWKVPNRAENLASPSEFQIKHRTSDAVSATGGVAVGPQGYVVIAGDGGARQEESRLSFLNPVNGEVVLRRWTGLREVRGLAYCPASGNLYALGSPPDGGVFRLDEPVAQPKFHNGGHVSAVKMANVARPTAMAFGPDGALYVTALSDAEDTQSEPGVLLKMTGEF